MKSKLKVNVCSLAAESRIIRKEVDRIKTTSPLKGADPECQELIQHRRWGLRNESRAAQLVYAFVRKVPYRVIERRADKENYKWTDTLNRVRAKRKKLGIRIEDWNAWLKGAIVAEPVEVG